MAVNKVILVGNVGNDPEVRHLDQDVKVANFRLATTESYRAKNGERVSSTEWHNIVLWRGLAGVVEQYVKKGSKLYIEGKITNRQYEKDGVTKYFTEIVANNMVMLDSKSTSENTGAEQNPPSTENNVSEPNVAQSSDEDDLPF